MENIQEYASEMPYEGSPLQLQREVEFLRTANKNLHDQLQSFWNTHVVPLEQKISDLMIENTRVVEGDRYRQDYFKRVTSGLESENKALREENTRLTTKFIEEEHTADHPNENLSYWQYQQFTRAAITKLKEEIERLKAELKNANSALDNISDMGHA